MQTYIFQELKACFESRDTELLQKTIASMPVESAKYHMKRCVDSGLWVPNAADLENAEEKTEEDTSKDQPTKSEPVYTGVSTEDVD